MNYMSTEEAIRRRIFGYGKYMTVIVTHIEIRPGSLYCGTPLGAADTLFSGCHHDTRVHSLQFDPVKQAVSGCRCGLLHMIN